MVPNSGIKAKRKIRYSVPCWTDFRGYHTCVKYEDVTIVGFVTNRTHVEAIFADQFGKLSNAPIDEFALKEEKEKQS